MKTFFFRNKRLLLPLLLVTLPVFLVAGVAGYFLYLAGATQAMWVVLVMALFVSLLASGIGWWHERGMSLDLMALASAADSLTQGDLSVRLPLSTVETIARLDQAFNTLAERMQTQIQLQQQDQWLKEGMNRLHRLLGQNPELIPLGNGVISFITTYLEATLGVFYVVHEDGTLRLTGTYAYHERKGCNNRFIPGEGVVGQVMLEKKYIIIHRPPKDYMVIQTGLGEGVPNTILAYPFLLNGEVKAIMELGRFSPCTDLHLTFLASVAESVAMAIMAAQARTRTEETLVQLREQRKVMQETSQALSLSNTQLEEQKNSLQLSQAQLIEQQEELRVSNEELEEQAQLLEEQKHEADRKNIELMAAQEELQRKAKDLQLANQYKSEFLANMSHELRTPLNSLLILAKSFMENPEKNLHERQVEDARIIYESGSDLLHLINDILDLSKIEAGRMTIHAERIDLPSYAGDLARRFNHMASSKGLTLLLEISPTKIWHPFLTDVDMLGRILKNLLANAFKFTKKGSVILRFAEAPDGWSPPNGSGTQAETVAISVRDTGIGIPLEKCHVIFEAFQQADGSISRQFGGTGLGLTICTHLTRLLGGEIRVESEVGKGSLFTLILPSLPISIPEQTSIEVKEPSVKSIPLPKQEVPTTPSPAIPTWNLPPCFSHDRPCALLIVEDDANARLAMIRLLQNHPVQVTQAEDGNKALSCLGTQLFDCMILDLGLPDINGFDLLDQIKQDSAITKPPVIVYSGRELTRDEYDRLKKHTDSIVVKGARSPTRLLDEMTLLLTKTTPETVKQEMNMEECDFTNKTVLLVDDDVRNAYALTRQLEQRQFKVRMAANGAKALEALEKYPEIDVVLMDVMMPVMDGLEAMRRLRTGLKWIDLPVIALTAKAMEEDRQQAMDAGANDYLPKPVDMNHLLVKLKNWLYRT